MSDPRYPNPNDMDYSVIFNCEFIEDTRDDNQGHSTVNCEYFLRLLKYFQTAKIVRKLNTQKYMRNINDNVVQGRLSNYLTRNIIA